MKHAVLGIISAVTLVAVQRPGALHEEDQRAFQAQPPRVAANLENPQEAPGKSSLSPFDTPLEGYGAGVKGGEGKEVMWVASAEELTKALSGGDRHIRFKAGGTFKGPFQIEHPNVTLDGRDAPAPGVTLTGEKGLTIVARNVVVRNLRVRDVGLGKKIADGIKIGSGASDVVVDHCSISNCGDGAIDITDYDQKGVKNITVSWCLIGPQHKAMLISQVKGGISIHHNLFYSTINRSPNIQESPLCDVRNNTVYNFKLYGMRAEAGTRANFVRNLLLAGAQTRQPPQSVVVVGEAYAEGNEGPGEVNKGNLSVPVDAPKVTTQAPREAAKLVLDKAGAFPRDGVDEALLKEMRGALGP